ncbi:hypothetical protein HPP92_022663 [Vanilla planifolia]|uniref:Uncharacterized protein n=1 Tax=Vanilla planifolia TaxID=51239 RepID=A0A835UFW3_VANPL|nr:hypothetical protein HPP92_022954 [Vanilla planifolia]KAG0459535.1 hypothetical protein HPP92_022663 [Vanilla planifolia]
MALGRIDESDESKSLSDHYDLTFRPVATAQTQLTCFSILFPLELNADLISWPILKYSPFLDAGLKRYGFSFFKLIIGISSTPLSKAAKRLSQRYADPPQLWCGLALPSSEIEIGFFPIRLSPIGPRNVIAKKSPPDFSSDLISCKQPFIHGRSISITSLP